MSRLELFPSRSRPLVFAHRGYSARAPENTLAAFRLAREEGIPGIELDVQLCGTGEVVVIHDYGLRRITGVKKPVAEASYTELREMDAGSWFARRFRDESIPLLADVFDTLGTSVYYDIEIKQRDDEETGIEEALARIITEYGFTSSVMVSSFNPAVVSRFKRALSSIPTAVIFASPKKVRHLLPGMGYAAHRGYDALKPYYRRVKPGYVVMQHGLYGYPLLAWTVNSVKAARKLVEIGVAGLVSDDPGPIHKALRTVNR